MSGKNRLDCDSGDSCEEIERNEMIMKRYVSNFRALYADGGRAMVDARERASKTPIETD